MGTDNKAAYVSPWRWVAKLRGEVVADAESASDLIIELRKRDLRGAVMQAVRRD